MLGCVAIGHVGVAEVPAGCLAVPVDGVAVVVGDGAAVDEVDLVSVAAERLGGEVSMTAWGQRWPA